MMFGEVQMAFWVGYKLKLSNKFIISKQNHRPDVKTFHHLLYGWPNNGFRLQSCWAMGLGSYMGGKQIPCIYNVQNLTLLVAGSWLPLLVAREGCLGPPLISPALTGRFLKFKRHSFRLNMIYIYKKRNFKIS